MINEKTINALAEQNLIKDIVNRHVTAFLDNKIQDLMADYTHDSVLITPDETYTGVDQISVYMAGLMSHFPKGKSKIDLDRMEVSDKLAYIVWHAETPSVLVTMATDTFVIKGDKIYQQTFAGQIRFLNQ